MRDKIRQYWFPALVFLLTLAASLFWVALRINYSGISKFLGADTNPTFLVMNLPVIVTAASFVGCAVAFIGLLVWDSRRRYTLIGLLAGIVMLVGALVVIRFGARDYLEFILPHFYKSLAAAAAVLAFALVLFFPARGHRSLPAKWLAVVLLTLAVTAVGYGWRGCRFTTGAVVYAVEEDYQIVFSTSDSAMAWVTVDGESYYDLYAGSSRSADRVHKVTVPQQALDAAGGYTVHAQQMIYRGPFGGYLGKELTKSYAFRGVDISDGLDYVSLSDVHSAVKAAEAAARNEKADFILLLGDMISMVETEADAQLTNRLAHAVTGGSMPVIYARGNHEIKGEYGEELYKYVGSLNQSYAYPVSLAGGRVAAVVLDMGEDHEDDWWEYYGTAQFDLYRAQQSEMLREMIDAGVGAGADYRLVACHIPIVTVEENGLFEGFRREWTALLNEWEPDICLSGHEHRLWYHLPGSTAAPAGTFHTDYDFPAFLTGRRSLQQAGGTQKNGSTDYVCLHTHVDLAAGTQTCSYVNSLGEVIAVLPPDGEGEAKTEIEMTLR